MKCGKCGERLVARPRSGGQCRYACAKGPGFNGCGSTYINADPVEEWVTDAALARLSIPELTAALARRQAETRRPSGGSEPLLDRDARCAQLAHRDLLVPVRRR